MEFKSNVKIFKNLLFNLAEPVLRKVILLKNYHYQQSCYAFGDGVSIKYFDLSLFSDKISFSIGNIFFHKSFDSLNVKYASIFEPYYFYPYRREKTPLKKINKNYIQKKYREFIRTNSKIRYFTSLSNYPVLWNSNIFYLFQKIPEDDFKFMNECFHNNEDIFKGSFRCVISLAIYMGFKEIILVGCDYTHEKAMSHHWFEKGKGLFKPLPEYQKKFLNIASKYINIKTITLEGKGTILPSITYNQYTGKKPIFCENTDLCDLSNLNTLSTWPGFKIF